MKNLLRVLAITLLAGVLLSACAGPVNNLYGSWRTTDPAQPAQTYEFRQDGSVLESQQGVIIEEIFEITGDNQGTMVFKAARDIPTNQGRLATFSLNGDTLILTNSSQTLTFARLK
jgi:hypothetical protein